MIGAAVAELEFEGLTSNRKPQNLVTETDAECRSIGAHQLTNVVDGVGQGCGISRSVAEKDSIGLDRDELARGCRRGKDPYVAAIRVQPAKNIPFDAEVVRRQSQPPGRSTLRCDAELTMVCVSRGDCPVPPIERHITGDASYQV